MNKNPVHYNNYHRGVHPLTTGGSVGMFSSQQWGVGLVLLRAKCECGADARSVDSPPGKYSFCQHSRRPYHSSLGPRTRWSTAHPRSLNDSAACDWALWWGQQSLWFGRCPAICAWGTWRWRHVGRSSGIWQVHDTRGRGRAFWKVGGRLQNVMRWGLEAFRLWKSRVGGC